MSYDYSGCLQRRGGGEGGGREGIDEIFGDGLRDGKEMEKRIRGNVGRWDRDMSQKKDNTIMFSEKEKVDMDNIQVNSEQVDKDLFRDNTDKKLVNHVSELFGSKECQCASEHCKRFLPMGY